MTGLTLHIDGDRWRAQLRQVAQAYPGIVPVAKGNGYGFTLPRLARRGDWLGVDTMAVGTYPEVDHVASRFSGDLLVMTPWQAAAPRSARVIHTVSRVSDLVTLAGQAPGTRVVVEGLTSMARHGMTRHELADAARALGRLRMEGLALHLPMTGDRLAEAEQWCAVLEASRLATSTVFVSHLGAADLGVLAERRPALTLRPRIGTALWLGDGSALRVTATVLDRHPVSRGERVGYRQRPVPRDGTLLVLAGGTSHGIGLEAPAAASSVRQRAVSLAKGGLAAAGFALSPFTVGGKARWFVEPPHMQASMVFLPSGVAPPAVGDEVNVVVRNTIATFDTVVFE
ncbi:MAG: alanine racemase [Nocardioidaceae bacterium]